MIAVPAVGIWVHSQGVVWDDRLVSSEAVEIVHPKGLAVDASIDTVTLEQHIPAGDAISTLPAWLAIALVHGIPADVPIQLSYDPAAVAGHFTAGVDGPFSDRAALDVMLANSGLHWRVSDDGLSVRIDTESRKDAVR